MCTVHSARAACAQHIFDIKATRFSSGDGGCGSRQVRGQTTTSHSSQLSVCLAQIAHAAARAMKTNTVGIYVVCSARSVRCVCLACIARVHAFELYLYAHDRHAHARAQAAHSFGRRRMGRRYFTITRARIPSIFCARARCGVGDGTRPASQHAIYIIHAAAIACFFYLCALRVRARYFPPFLCHHLIASNTSCANIRSCSSSSTTFTSSHRWHTFMEEK